MMDAAHFLIYARLLWKLLLPVNMARGLFWFGMVLIAIGGVCEWLWNSRLPLVLGIGIVFLVLIISAVAMPSQILALTTSKPIILLANFRRITAVAIFLDTFLFSIVIAMFVWHNHKADTPFTHLLFTDLLLTVLLLASICITGSIWLATRWPVLQGAVFFLLFLMQPAARWLLALNLVFILALLAGVWSLFMVWWFSWQPPKYFANIFACSGNLLAEGKNNYATWFFYQGKANSWPGSRLSGLPDSLGAQGKRALLALPFLLFSVIPLYFLMQEKEFLFFLVNSYLFFCLVQLGLLGNISLAAFYRHISLLWLCVPGNRSDLLQFLRRRYWFSIAVYGACVAVLLVALCWVFEKSYPLSVWLFLVSASLLNCFIMFNLTWIIYQKSSASLAWFSLLNALFAFVWIFLLLASGQLFELPFGLQPLSPLLVLLVLVSAALASHVWVQKNFATINLLRAV